MDITLRPLEVNDAYTSVKWRNDPEIWVHTTFRATKEITIENELEWIRKVTTDPGDKRFAIVVDGTYIGNTYLTGIHDGTADYHIFIGDKTYWGKGIAKEVLRQILAYAKNTLNLKTVELGVKEANPAALHIYKKFGFIENGTEDGFLRMKLDLSQYVHQQ